MVVLLIWRVYWIGPRSIQYYLTKTQNRYSSNRNGLFGLYLGLLPTDVVFTFQSPLVFSKARTLIWLSGKRQKFFVHYRNKTPVRKKLDDPDVFVHHSVRFVLLPSRANNFWSERCNTFLVDIHDWYAFLSRCYTNTWGFLTLRKSSGCPSNLTCRLPSYFNVCTYFMPPLFNVFLIESSSSLVRIFSF